MDNRFVLNRDEGKFLGVAAGLSDKTGIDPLIVRLGFIAATVIAGPVTIFVYLVTGWLAPER